MYEHLYTLTQMFFKSLKGNLMFEVPVRRSKSTKGWRYGFKLSGVCNENDDFENIIIIYDKP